MRDDIINQSQTSLPLTTGTTGGGSVVSLADDVSVNNKYLLSTLETKQQQQQQEQEKLQQTTIPSMTISFDERSDINNINSDSNMRNNKNDNYGDEDERSRNTTTTTTEAAAAAGVEEEEESQVIEYESWNRESSSVCSAKSDDNYDRFIVNPSVHGDESVSMMNEVDDHRMKTANDDDNMLRESLSFDENMDDDNQSQKVQYSPPTITNNTNTTTAIKDNFTPTAKGSISTTNSQHQHTDDDSTTVTFFSHITSNSFDPSLATWDENSQTYRNAIAAVNSAAMVLKSGGNFTVAHATAATILALQPPADSSSLSDDASCAASCDDDDDASPPSSNASARENAKVTAAAAIAVAALCAGVDEKKTTYQVMTIMTDEEAWEKMTNDNNDNFVECSMEDGSNAESGYSSITTDGSRSLEEQRFYLKEMEDKAVQYFKAIVGRVKESVHENVKVNPEFGVKAKMTTTQEEVVEKTKEEVVEKTKEEVVEKTKEEVAEEDCEQKVNWTKKKKNVSDESEETDSTKSPSSTTTTASTTTPREAKEYECHCAPEESVNEIMSEVKLNERTQSYQSMEAQNKLRDCCEENAVLLKEMARVTMRYVGVKTEQKTSRKMAISADCGACSGPSVDVTSKEMKEMEDDGLNGINENDNTIDEDIEEEEEEEEEEEKEMIETAEVEEEQTAAAPEDDEMKDKSNDKSLLESTAVVTAAAAAATVAVVAAAAIDQDKEPECPNGDDESDDKSTSNQCNPQERTQPLPGCENNNNNKTTNNDNNNSNNNDGDDVDKTPPNDCNPQEQQQQQQIQQPLLPVVSNVPQDEEDNIDPTVTDSTRTITEIVDDSSTSIKATAPTPPPTTLPRRKKFGMASLISSKKSTTKKTTPTPSATMTSTAMATTATTKKNKKTRGTWKTFRKSNITNQNTKTTTTTKTTNDKAHEDDKQQQQQQQPFSQPMLLSSQSFSIKHTMSTTIDNDGELTGEETIEVEIDPTVEDIELVIDNNNDTTNDAKTTVTVETDGNSKRTGKTNKSTLRWRQKSKKLAASLMGKQQQQQQK